MIPPPIGVTYAEQTIKLIGSTAIREFNYDGYMLGNETIGLYDSFRLYGTLYLFDGDWIHSTQLTGNMLTRIDHVANALGLVFLAESPQAIFFLSTFDNSLYSFDGGQSVNKIMRFNRKEPIRGAVYNTRENTLAIFADDYVMWMRDSIITQISLPFVWPYVAFSTSDGIWLAKDKYSVRYLYNPIALSGGTGISFELDGGIWGTVYTDTYDGGTWGTVYADTYDGEVWGGESGTVVPLEWQSKYNGYSERTRQNVDRYLFRVYKEDLEPVDITVTYDYFTEEGHSSESRTITAGDINNPFDDEGYAYIEFIPSQKASIGSSITLYCESKIVYLDAMASINPAAETVAKNRK